ncbi:MAG: glucosidase [Ignavibacteriaceae bacterium]
MPQIWLRNTWFGRKQTAKPELQLIRNGIIEIKNTTAENYFLYYNGNPEYLFCDNKTNTRRLSGIDSSGYFKDGINEFIVNGNKNAVNNLNKGTKAALNFKTIIEGGKSAEVILRLSNKKIDKPFENFDKMICQNQKEADDFYHSVQTELKDADEKNIQRQAFAGMLWNKQFYYYNVSQWLHSNGNQEDLSAKRKSIRNTEWFHIDNADIISMPDKWEYPWYATWDVAFHCISLALIDPEFAKQQLILFTKESYMHPNGQLPAYEWNFNDVNPPVHAWASWRVYKIDEKKNGKGDQDFLERIFHKLLLNFTWWVNKKDMEGRNIFQGGFLGMDNIGVFDRSNGVPEGNHIDQADATSWVAMYCLNLMRIALELSMKKPLYQDLASKFFEHFLYIAKAMTNLGDEGIGLWDEADEFYYDVLHKEHGQSIKLKLRSMVGLIPLFAVEVLDPETMNRTPEFQKKLNWFLENKPDLANLVSSWCEVGVGERNLLSLLRGHRMKCLLRRMLDETEFLSKFGIRSLSKVYETEPYTFRTNGTEFKVSYSAAESDTGLFGGNSNWRGPVWFPVNFLIIESLQKFHHYYGDDFKIEYPANSGDFITINEVAQELSARLKSIFIRNKNGKRPVYGNNKKLQEDIHFKDYILFYEYFHGDNGAGLGASHQTGWTGLIAKLLQPKESK